MLELGNKLDGEEIETNFIAVYICIFSESPSHYHHLTPLNHILGNILGLLSFIFTLNQSKMESIKEKY